MDLLTAYLNTPPELNELIQCLSKLPERSDSAEEFIVQSPAPKLRSSLPRSIIAKIATEYQAGNSSRALCLKYDLPRSSLQAILKKQGVLRRQERLSDEQIQAAAELISTGLSAKIAASELDIAVRSLYHQLKVRGLPTKKTS